VEEGSLEADSVANNLEKKASTDMTSETMPEDTDLK
jgi:hypothetical protein